MNQQKTTDVSKPLWIEVVTDTYVPDINGVAFSLGRLCRGLRERGHRVSILRSGRAGDESDVWLPWWRLPGYPEVRVGAPWPGQLRRHWQKQRPDVVYVAIETPLGFSAVSAARRLGIPVVGGFHTNFREYLRNYGASWVSEQVWRYQKWFHRRLARTIVPSPDAHEKLVEAGFSNLRVLGRGVDTTLYHPQKRSIEKRREWGVNGDAPVALVVGRISNEKNIELAFRAFEGMRRSQPDTTCVVVGDGPSRARLQREHPNVRFDGFQVGENLAVCYASADILLFTSETETFGNVLIEGMASGLAVLAYDYAAAAWHCEDRVNAIKVKKFDEAAFLRGAEVLLDPTLRANLGREARLTAEGLDWPSVVGQLETILREVITSSQTPSP